MRSARLKQQNGNLTHIEVNKMLSLVSDVRTEVSAYDAVPGRIIFFIKLFFYISCNIFLNIEFLKSNVCIINRILLHFLIHVCMLDHGLPLSCSHLILNIINENRTSR